MDFDFDLVVIGSGPGGYVAALRAAQLGLKTACIEKSPTLGGTCLNVGCIPSKTLLHATEMYAKLLHEGKRHGIIAKELSYDWSTMQKRRLEVVGGFNQGIAALFKRGKIESITGVAKLEGPHQIEVEANGKKRVLTTRSIILATGSEPVALPFLPFDEKIVLSSTGALALGKIPQKMVVVGAGVIGLELGSVYSRLGTEVQFIEFFDRICPILDEAVSKQFQQVLTSQGMAFQLSSKVTSASMSGRGVLLQIEASQGEHQEIQTEVVLIAIGRRPYSQGLGLEKVGIHLDPKGFVVIDSAFRTSIPSIYAIGDLVDGPMLAHKASEEGVAAVEIIAGLRPMIDYTCIPSVVYTSPEVAAVGLTEAEAKRHGLEVKIGTFSFKANSRAKCNGEETGFVKIVAEKESGRLLGAHILGANASELIAECVIALEKRMTTTQLAGICHAHPTLSEAIKEAALAAEGRALHQ